MKSIINELWHGNIVPQEDSRTNSKEMKELIGYIARHNEDLMKLLNDEQTEIFEKYLHKVSSAVEYTDDICFRMSMLSATGQPSKFASQ